jgi:hypothetical protein
LTSCLYHDYLILIFMHFTYLLYENISLIIVSAETEYFSTRSWYRKINFIRDKANLFIALVKIINISNMCSNIPAFPANGVYISQLIRYTRSSSNYFDFLKRHLYLIHFHIYFMKIHRLLSSLQRQNIFRQDLGIGK